MKTNNNSHNPTVQKLLAAVENTADTVVITNKSGLIEYVNPAWEKLTGYAKSEAINMTPKLLKSGHHDSRFYKKLWMNILKGKTYRVVFINKKKNNELYYQEETITPIADNVGQVEYFVSTGRDVTKRREQEIRTEFFIGMAGHELKTPLTTIKAFAQLLQRKTDKKKDEKTYYYLSKINSKVDLLTTLINNLLNITKIKTGKLEYNLERLDFDRLIKEIVNDNQRGIDTHQLILSGKTEKNVLVDKLRIGEVLTNLINNAVKYSPIANKIVINLFVDSDNVIVAVQDYGIGIPKTSQKKIFDLYYQVKDNDKLNVAGLGIGLYLTSEIIRSHKGKLWVESEKGKGSTFYFSIPIKK